MKQIQQFSWLCLFLLFTHAAQAQTFLQRGNIELGGDISFSSMKEPEYDNSLNTFTFNPYIGCMFSGGFELGFRPQLTIVSYDGSSYTTMGLFLAPAYNMNAGSIVYPYLELLIGYNSINNDEDNYGGLGLGVDGGLKINIAGNSLLLIKLEYLHQEYDIDDENESINTLSFGVGFRIFLPPHTAAK